MKPCVRQLKYDITARRSAPRNEEALACKRRAPTAESPTVPNRNAHLTPITWSQRSQKRIASGNRSAPSGCWRCSSKTSLIFRPVAATSRDLEVNTKKKDFFIYFLFYWRVLKQNSNQSFLSFQIIIVLFSGGLRGGLKGPKIVQGGKFSKRPKNCQKSIKMKKKNNWKK